MSNKTYFYLTSLLLTTSALQCSQKNQKKITPTLPQHIEVAVRTGNKAKVQKFLDENERNANAKGRNGTILGIAAFYNHTEIVQAILDKKPEIDQTHPTGLNPLQIAAFFGNTDTVKLLIDHNADTQKKTSEGETALSLAEKQCKNLTLNTAYHNIIAILSPKNSLSKI